MDTFSHGFWIFFIFRRFAYLRQLVLGAIGPDLVFLVPYPLVLTYPAALAIAVSFAAGGFFLPGSR